MHTHMTIFGNLMINIIQQIKEKGHPRAWELGHYSSDCQNGPWPHFGQVTSPQPISRHALRLGVAQRSLQTSILDRAALFRMMTSRAWMRAILWQLATVPASSPSHIELIIWSFIKHWGLQIKKYEHAAMSTRYWHLLSWHTAEDEPSLG